MHLVYVDGFWMDRHEVTNEEFARFVEATEYKTTAEKPPPEVKGYVPEDRKKFLTNPWSVVFKIPKDPIDAREVFPGMAPPWWEPVIGACWKHPEGPGSTIKGREKHPVVHISWDDAVAYCKWAEKRLPTEAEWEFAARGGLDRKPFVWGDEKDPKGMPAANYWQGNFPNEDEKTDGFHGTSPVGSFQPNGYGLFDMAGNVWEWCADYYQADYYLRSPYRNPKGPTIGVNPLEYNTAARVRRGGSFLCADNYCQRFIPAARHHGEPDLAHQHSGFRCVRDVKK
jgi:formylglycine-generating enzyme required for sulfatase activity